MLTISAITVLSGPCLTSLNNGEYMRNVSGFIHEFNDSTSFALMLAAELHQKNGQIDRAADCFKMSLKHNPFLFTPLQKLCHIKKVINIKFIL
jgi:anaphase-promoting complex subunit 3